MLWAYRSSVLCIYVVPVLLYKSHCACLYSVVFRAIPPTYFCRFCWQLLVAKVSPIATLELCTFVLVLNVPSSTSLDGSRRYKHLTTQREGRHFPLFFSGYFYRLNIPSVALHLSLEFGKWKKGVSEDWTEHNCIPRPQTQTICSCFAPSFPMHCNKYVNGRNFTFAYSKTI